MVHQLTMFCYRMTTTPWCRGHLQATIAITSARKGQVSDSANLLHVLDPLPRHCGIIIALDGSEP